MPPLPPTSVARRDADPGLFGPGSATWQVHEEVVVAVGGLRALLLQALHPESLRVFAASSGFREGFWERLRSTAEYVSLVTYAPLPEVLRTTARVRGVHRRLPAVDGHRADDEDLLLWVHCCLTDSFLAVARHAGLSLPRTTQDDYVAEQARLAPLVGIHSLQAPRHRAGLEAYLSSVRPRLRATAETRGAVAVLVAPPMDVRVLLATPALPAWGSLVALAAGTLPGWARRAYGLPGLPVGVVAGAGVRALRTGTSVLPAGWRTAPHRQAAYARLGLDLATGRPVPDIAS